MSGDPPRRTQAERDASFRAEAHTGDAPFARRKQATDDEAPAPWEREVAERRLYAAFARAEEIIARAGIRGADHHHQPAGMRLRAHEYVRSDACPDDAADVIRAFLRARDDVAMELADLAADLVLAAAARRRGGPVTRDPERIPRITALLERVWRAHPDWRFGQLLSVLFRGQDAYWPEDDWTEGHLLACLGESGDPGPVFLPRGDGGDLQ